jgi:hypothetical protein
MPVLFLRRLLWTVIALSALSLVGTELWFRTQEHKRVGNPHWTIALPRDRARFHEDAISEKVKAALQFDSGISAQWRNPDATTWQFFHFRWNPATTLKDRVRIHLAKSHRPEICLSAGGWKLQHESPATNLEVAGIPLSFRTYNFSFGEQTVFVFFCVREDSTDSDKGGNMRETHAARWRAAWEGNRGLGQRSIEVAISGANDLAEAEASFRQELPRLIHIEPR